MREQQEKRWDFAKEYKKDIKSIIEKKNLETASLRKYQFPPEVDHHDPNIKSKNLQNLLVCMEVKEKFRIISDLAFDALDKDGSGQLDESELK